MEAGCTSWRFRRSEIRRSTRKSARLSVKLQIGLYVPGPIEFDQKTHLAMQDNRIISRSPTSRFQTANGCLIASPNEIRDRANPQAALDQTIGMLRATPEVTRRGEDQTTCESFQPLRLRSFDDPGRRASHRSRSAACGPSTTSASPLAPMRSLASRGRTAAEKARCFNVLD